jgi:hypothetical protein
MTHSSPGSPNPFAVHEPSAAPDGRHEPVHRRTMSLPLRMDDGTVRTFEVPAALAHPSRFTAAELERLTRAYAEALGLIQPKP